MAYTLSAEILPAGRQVWQCTALLCRTLGRCCKLSSGESIPAPVLVIYMYFIQFIVSDNISPLSHGHIYIILTMIGVYIVPDASSHTCARSAR